MHINFGNRKFFNVFDINIVALQNAINHVYGLQIEKPIFVTFNNRLKKFAGKHGYHGFNPRRRRWMTPEFIETLNERKCYHEITMAGEKVYDTYDKNNFMKHFFHTLAHELQHAIQKDDQSNYRLTYQFSDYYQYWPSNFYYHTPQEADAEFGAMMNTMKLIEAYNNFVKD